MTKLRLDEDDSLNWFESNWSGATEVEFTDEEIVRIRRAQSEYDTVQNMIHQRIYGHRRGTYPDEDQT